jgi:hypothetical protein
MSQNKNIKRNTFTEIEDKILFNFVQQYGENWELISSLMINRNIRQVKDRYHYYLDPSINNDPWSHEEDQKLIELISKYGKKWKKISEHFDGRNEIKVKNRWNYTLAKQYSTKIETSNEESTITEENRTQNINKEIDLFNFEEDIEFYLYSIQSVEFDNLCL